MISSNSLNHFLSINLTLLCFGSFQYYIIRQLFQQYSMMYQFLCIFILFLSRNYAMLNTIDYMTKTKPRINAALPVENYYREFDVNVFSNTAVETVTYLFVQTYMSDLFVAISINDIIWFIPISFWYEVVFDFFHYWAHRISHTQPFLYKHFHKSHHTFLHPTSIITYYQHPIDIIISNSIPTVLTLIIVPRISMYEFNLILLYKTYIEICGHTGKQTYPTSCFCQFIWLPRLLGIQLYSEDHDLHHSLFHCNYSKRFALWDQVFGTYTRYSPK